MSNENNYMLTTTVFSNLCRTCSCSKTLSQLQMRSDASAADNYGLCKNIVAKGEITHNNELFLVLSQFVQLF